MMFLFEIMPTQKDVPVIQYVSYISETDQLTIMFASDESNHLLVDFNDYVAFYISVKDQISGITINQVTDLKNSVSSNTLIEKLNIKSLNKKNLGWKEAVKTNIQRRNLESIKDFFLDSATELELT